MKIKEVKSLQISQKTQLVFSAIPSTSTDHFIKSPIYIHVQERNKQILMTTMICCDPEYSEVSGILFHKGKQVGAEEVV